MRQLRLCFVGWGDHVHLERWAGYLVQLGYDVSVVSLSGPGRYPDSVRQYTLGLRQRGLRWKILKLRYLLARIRPDIVHVHWAHFSYLAARATDRALVVTAWGSDVYRLQEVTEEEFGQLQYGLRAARVITCDSEDQRGRLRLIPGVGRDKIHVIQWGVDVDVFRPGPADPALVAELDLSGRPVVFSPRHLLPLYNQETVIAAFARVRQQLPDAVLILKQYAAEPKYVARLKDQIDAAGLRDSIRIVGTLPYERMAALYRLAAVTVSVPLSDGTPMSVLEAMACGSVPVVSDLASLREWIRDGWNGYLVPAKDAEALAARIARLLTTPELRSIAVDRNLEIVRERATQRANMARMDELYRGLAMPRQSSTA